jgi:hypothetical protein
MKGFGFVLALAAGVGVAAPLALTAKRAGFSVTRSEDGELTVKPWTYNAELVVDEDLRALFREFRPGEHGDWIYTGHYRISLSYDRVRIDRGAASLDYTRGRSRYWLSLAGLAAAPAVLWGLVAGLATVFGKETRPE